MKGGHRRQVSRGFASSHSIGRHEILYRCRTRPRQWSIGWQIHPAAWDAAVGIGPLGERDPAPACRRKAGVSAKSSGEMRLAGKAALECDLCERQVVVSKQRLRPFNA
jgi:hypothetical protein